MKPSETSGGFFLQKSFLFLWRIEKHFYLWDMNNTLMHEEIIKVCRGFLKHEEQMTTEHGPMWTIGVARGHLRFIADLLEPEIQDNAEA